MEIEKMNNDYRQIENFTKEIMGLLYECLCVKGSDFNRLVMEIFILQKRVRKILRNNGIDHLHPRSLLFGSLELSDTGDYVKNKKHIKDLASSFLKKVRFAFDKKSNSRVHELGFVPESIIKMLESNADLADWFFFDFLKGDYAIGKKQLYEDGVITTDEYELFLLTHAHLWLEEQEERAGGSEWN